jgi:class 3 adenylate cyclase/tetratricopeptide (TPR) repeat protein
MDPESLRRVISRYFDDMRAALERHGGTIEKFIGDAVMAVFGIPVLHEDDALRGVRAAADMQKAMALINEDLIRDHGVGLKARIGVNTGEVIAGDHSQGQAFATGDTVNVAARFEQAAAAGEILIGEDTYELVRDWVEVESVEPLELKGKSERLPAFRLIDVRDAPDAGRHLASPFVGRDKELDQLVAGFDRATSESTSHLVTVLGPAGVGKSRITSELVERLGDRSRVIVGHCLPYGEGITFWPLAEAVKDAAGVADDDDPATAAAKVASLVIGDPDAELIVQRLMEMLGLADAASEAQELFWAVRKFFEKVASDKPVTVVFDDIHWAEPTFLDLIEYLVGWSKGFPVFLVCLARNEFVELRPTWGSGMANVQTVTLDPLSEDATDQLIVSLLGGANVPVTARRRIVETTEGNPLFVGEMLRMMVDDGVLTKTDDGWSVTGDIDSIPMPGSIQALVASRLDRLDAEERQVVGRASVIGRVFWWGAISQLTPDGLRSGVAGHLQTLVRRELIQPEQSTFPGEDAFRFSSVLISDSAYQGLAKKLRADLHETFTAWLERKFGDRVREFEEILGYHLERSYTYRKELGVMDDKTRETGARAAQLLGAAGKRALERADMHAAANLLSRAVALLDAKDPYRIELQLDLSSAVMETEGPDDAVVVLDMASAAAAEIDNLRLMARARVQESILDMYAEAGEGWKEKALTVARDAIHIFEQAGDEHGITQAQLLMAEAYWTESQYAEVEKILDEALAHAQKAGSPRDEAKILGWLPSVAFWGPTHVDQALKLCEAVLGIAKGNRMVQAKTTFSMAALHAMRSEFDTARNLIAEGRGLFAELGLAFSIAHTNQMSGMIEMLARDYAAAEREFRNGYSMLEEMGDKGYLPSFAALIGEALYEQGRYEDADRFTKTSEETSASDDVMLKADWGPVRSKLMARAGDATGAEALAREVVQITSGTDEIYDHADALMDLAEVLRLVGKPDEAAAHAAESLKLFEKKGVIPAIERAKAFLAAVAA